MTHASKFFALTASTLALVAGSAFAHEGTGSESQAFVSARTRAEVQAEALQAARAPLANGEVGAGVLFAAPAQPSTLTRAAVRQDAITAARAHTVKVGEFN